MGYPIKQNGGVRKRKLFVALCLIVIFMATCFKIRSSLICQRDPGKMPIEDQTSNCHVQPAGTNRKPGDQRSDEERNQKQLVETLGIVPPSMKHESESMLNFPELDSTTCYFPVLDSITPTIRKYFRRYPTLDCSHGIPSIVDVVDNELKINPRKVKQKLGLTGVQGCKYRRLLRKAGDDFKVIYSSWSQTFTTSIRIGVKDEHLQVDCFNEGRLVARSYLALLKLKKEIEDKRLGDYQNHAKNNSPKETLSVFLLGVDGISKQNFKRSMPRTREFLVDNLNAIELHKFNKLGLNTFPNIVPLLTGLHVSEIKHWTKKEPFDKIDHLFLWNQYQKNGYRTCVQLDSVNITEFHYVKQGFSKPTFDFYHRPIVLASEEDEQYRSKLDNCMGDTPEITFNLDYFLRLTAAYNNTPSKPYFVYTIQNRLTHDEQNLASAGDELYLAFLRKVVNERVLNNTLLIFFSDHGERFGKIRNTYNGMLESKMPMIFFVFPPWFERKYPEVTKILRVNANRLTTFFDVHATLRDILYFTGNPQKASPSDRGISLFSEIPGNRTCSVAGIPLEYCLCNRISRPSAITNEYQDILAEALLENINQRTDKYRHECPPLKLRVVLYVLSVIPDRSYFRQNNSLYQVTIETTPNHGLYEGMVSLEADTKKATTVSEDVICLNLYRGLADCIDELSVRPFCACYQKTWARDEF